MHELLDEEQILFSAELMVDVDGVVLEPGPNCWVAEIRGLVQGDKLLSLFRFERKDEQAELIFEGIRGLALDVEVAAGDAWNGDNQYDC